MVPRQQRLPASAAPASSSRAPDALAELSADHRRLVRLLGQLERAEDPRVRELLFQDAQDELHVHGRLELELLEPALVSASARAGDRRLLLESREERALTDRLLEAMRGTETASEQFAAQCRLLRGQAQRHAQAEEARLFPAARRALGRAQLTDLGRTLRRRRAELHGASDAPVEWQRFPPGTD